MRFISPAVLTVAIVACATLPEASSPIADVNRVGVEPGCYGHVSEGDWNVHLSTDLEASLMGQVKEHASGSRCWYKKRSGQLLVAIGDECGRHYEALFEKTAEQWTLVKAGEVRLVHCDIRK